jgi:MBG domain-containing protein
MPNRYGCASGIACGPGGDNIFIYTERPNATVFIGSAIRDLGVPNPNFGFTVAGVLTSLGDANAQAASGTPVTSAGMLAGPGSYVITRGTIDSRVGYNLTFVDGTLLVQAQGGNIYRPPVDSPAAAISVPQICTAIAPAPVAYSEANDGDAMDREWSRVKQRLVLSTCTGVRLKESCGDF